MLLKNLDVLTALIFIYYLFYLVMFLGNSTVQMKSFKGKIIFSEILFLFKFSKCKIFPDSVNHHDFNFDLIFMIVIFAIVEQPSVACARIQSCGWMPDTKVHHGSCG